MRAWGGVKSGCVGGWLGVVVVCRWRVAILSILRCVQLCLVYTGPIGDIGLSTVAASYTAVVCYMIKQDTPRVALGPPFSVCMPVYYFLQAISRVQVPSARHESCQCCTLRLGLTLHINFIYCRPLIAYSSCTQYAVLP